MIHPGTIAIVDSMVGAGVLGVATVLIIPGVAQVIAGERYGPANIVDIILNDIAINIVHVLKYQLHDKHFNYLLQD